MIEIDGSYGEGGGQIIRTSIALSALVKKKIKIKKIRANRPKPGLASQHLVGLKALQKITNAQVDGLKLGSSQIEFDPKTIKPGSYVIDIGTAGSITLVLQALLLPCSFSKERVNLRISGGTDVKWAPPIDYVKNVFSPIIQKMGFRADIKLVRRGYYPKGRGEVLVNVHPVKALKSIKLVDAGEVIAVKGISHSSNLPRHIVERMARSAGELLGRYKPNIEHECGKGLSQGCGITLWAELSNSFLGSSAIGELGKPAEKVGAEAGGDMIKEIESKVPLDKYMGDQIIPYMALANGRSTIKIRELTDHLKTNIYITEKILGNKFDIAEDEHYIISTKGLGLKSNESS